MVFRFRATGIANGGNRPCIYDISRSVDGEHLLTDSPVPFDSAGKNLGNAYVMTCRDDVRKGFWVCEPMLRGELILLKPFIDSDGSFRTSVQYWPGIAGNSGQALFHIPELDYLVCVSGASFRGNWGGKNFAYLAILSPGATPAAAKTWRVGYVPEKGAFWPNATYDGWYGNAKQINSFTIRDKGTKYIVGDKVFARVRGTIKVINGSFQWVDATVKGQAGLVVTKVDDAGGIREVVFQTVDYQGFPLADNGYFSSTPGSISNGQAINMPLDGTVGSGATIDCVMVPSISALEVQKLGLQWVASRRAAYGWVDDIDAKAKPVKLSIPRNPTVDNWIINSPSLSHDETDVNGDPDLVYAVNGTYRKTRYWPEQDVWIRFVSVERNPQIISMD